MPIPVHKQFTEQQQELVRSLHSAGKTQDDIAFQFGVPRRTMGKLCRHLGLTRTNSAAVSLTIQSPLNTPETIEAIRELRESGASLFTIAEKFNSSQTAVSRLCTEHSIIAPELFTEEFKNKVVARYNFGMSSRAVGSEFGISAVTVCNWVHQSGQDVRDPLMRFEGGGQRKLNQEHIIEDYHHLKSMSKVAEKHDCSVEGVKQVLLRHGIKPTSTSELFLGEGNPFFGKTHDDDTKDKCRQIGSEHGAKFWIDNPEYIEIVREKQRLLWSDLSKRREDSERISKLRREGKCNSFKGSLSTRFGVIPFDSSYEAAFIEACDQDGRVKNLERDFMCIGYTYDGERNFIPDFRVWLSNGEFIIVEVKSDWYAKLPKEQAKIKAGFGMFADKFLVIDKDLNRFFERVTSSYEQYDFEFSDLILLDVSAPDYKRFYGSFHYLGSAPRGGATVGAYLHDRLIACATYSPLSRIETAKRLGCAVSEVRELGRFCIHPDFQKKNLASWMLSKSTKHFMRNSSVKTIVTFADTTQGHTGTIYKAAGWVADGRTGVSHHYEDDNGVRLHKRAIWKKSNELGISEQEYARINNLQRIKELPKQRFIYKR